MMAEAARLSRGNTKAASTIGYTLAVTGREREAREVLATLEQRATERYTSPYGVALIHAGLGDRDAMYEWLERAFAERDVHLIYLPIDPKWTRSEGEARFAALAARVDGGVTQRTQLRPSRGESRRGDTAHAHAVNARQDRTRERTKPIRATAITTSRIPVQTPALKIPSMAWHPESSNASGITGHARRIETEPFVMSTSSSDGRAMSAPGLTSPRSLVPRRNFVDPGVAIVLKLPGAWRTGSTKEAHPRVCCGSLTRRM